MSMVNVAGPWSDDIKRQIDQFIAEAKDPNERTKRERAVAASRKGRAVPEPLGKEIAGLFKQITEALQQMLA